LFALGVALLISKLNDYPWARPDINEDAHYRALAGFHGVNSDKFWSLYDIHFSDDFKNLIESMLAFDPSSRPTIVDIFGHSWFRGEADSVAQFKQKCETIFKKAQEELNSTNAIQGVDYAVNPERRSDATFD
jgi:serine/threonine protein kinase